ncbi:MAG: hypothetical protein R3320_08365, partial [Nitriliruptorales bacterium]|nr:hypothetical protein [Nitriliruptorales bacterium]
MSTTDTAHPQAQEAKVSGIRIAYFLFGGIFAWMAHLIGQSALTGRVCATGELWSMHAITAVTLLFTFHALFLAWRTGRAEPVSANVDAARMLGWAGVVINVFNVVAIVAEWVPVLFIDPCAG